MKKALLVILLSLIGVGSKAQILDTSEAHRYKPLEVYKFAAEDILFFASDSTPIDTSLNLFYKYYPAYQNNFPFVDLGLEASPLLDLSTSNENELSLNLGFGYTTPLFFEDDLQIYHMARPYTRLNYSQGANEIIHLDITHAQQISERLTFGVDYRRIKNQNFYYSNIENISSGRMNNMFNNRFYTGYYTKDRKYELVASYLWNKSQNIETGGVVSDSIFNSQSGRVKLTNNAALLTDAESSYAQNSFKLTQYYRPGGMSTDSSLDQSLSQFVSQFYLNTIFSNDRTEFYDNDPDSLVYGQNISPFYDSIHHRKLSNEFGIAIKGANPVTLAVGLNHSYDQIFMNGFDTSFQNVYAIGKSRIALKKFLLNASAKIGLLGYNLGDYHVNATARADIKDLSIKGKFLSQLVEPAFTQQIFYSSVVGWNNSFKKVSINQIGGEAALELNQHNFKADVMAETSSGLVYYDQSGINQYDDLLSFLKLNFQYAYSNSHFGTSASATFQNSSNQQVLPRPNSAANANVYSQFRLFKKNLSVQLGARTFWFSSFESPIYNPLTKQWHNSNITYDMYPPVNVYANARVKSFCMGVELFHAQQGFADNAYYSSPMYPMMPRNFRLNLRWDLNN